MKIVLRPLQFTTNGGRIAFFGDPQKNYSLVYEPGEEGRLAAIYAGWGYYTAGVAHVSIGKQITNQEN